MEDSYGKLYVMIMNELRCPISVSQSVTIIIEVSACEDMEYAVPLQIIRNPSLTPETSEAFMVQMDGTGGGCDIIGKDTIGNSAMSRDEFTASRFCVGEKISSLLQLLKRSIPIYDLNLAAGSRVTLRPFTIGLNYYEEGGAVSSIFAGDYISIFGPMFAYNRGGVRIRLIGHAGTNQSFYIRCNYEASAVTDEYTVAVLSGGALRGSNCYFFNTNTPPTLDCPQYGRLHSRLNMFSTGTVILEPNNVYTSNMAVKYNHMNGETTTFEASRQCSDDFSFGFFVGCPLVVLSMV
jgi:hypothetical protein